MKKLFIILTILLSGYAYSVVDAHDESKKDIIKASFNEGVKPTKENIDYFCEVYSELLFNINYNALREVIGDLADKYLSKASIHYGEGYINIKHTFEYDLLKINEKQYLDKKNAAEYLLSTNDKDLEDYMFSIKDNVKQNCNKYPQKLLPNYELIFKQ